MVHIQIAYFGIVVSLRNLIVRLYAFPLFLTENLFVSVLFWTQCSYDDCVYEACLGPLVRQPPFVLSEWL